jgi:hypothetical protein
MARLAEMAAFVLIFWGGLITAFFCACVAVRKATPLKTSRILLVAAIVLSLAQIGYWQVALWYDATHHSSAARNHVK